VDIVGAVRKLTRPLEHRINALVKRAIIERINDSGGIQLVQVSMLGDDVSDKAEHMQPYGLTFHPPAGSEAVAASPQGDPSHVLVLGAQSRDHRPTDVAEGEGGLHYLGTWKVFLAEDGTVRLGAKDPSQFVALANKVDQRIKALEDWAQDFVTNVYLAHTHPSPAGPTGTPQPSGTPPQNGSSTAASKTKAE
jgi:phage gp45-like